MHSRNLRSNWSASANHIWLKALYFSRNPGKAVASTRHRKVDFHHFFKAYTSSHHLQMCISFETASFTWPLLGQLRKECIWFLHITPAVHLRYNIVHERLFIWFHMIIDWFFYSCSLISSFDTRNALQLYFIPFACVCQVMCHVQTHTKIDFPTRTSHHIDSVVGLPLVVNFCIKKLLSNKLAKTWAGINQGHVTARNIIRTFVSSLTTFNIQIRIRQPVLTRPCNYIMMDIKLDLQRRWWQPGTPCIANAKTVSRVKMSEPQARSCPINMAATDLIPPGALQSMPFNMGLFGPQ